MVKLMHLAPLPKPLSAQRDDEVMDSPRLAQCLEMCCFGPKAERTPTNQSSLADKDHIFNGLLEQVLQEHKKIVRIAREELLTEIDQLRKENSQLRSEHSGREHNCLSRSDMPAKEHNITSPRRDISNPGLSTSVQPCHNNSDTDLTAVCHATSRGDISQAKATQPLKAFHLIPQVETEPEIKHSPEVQQHAGHDLASTKDVRRPNLSWFTKSERYMISPVSRVRLIWDFVAFCCLLTDLWATPVQLVFMAEDVVPMEFHSLNTVIVVFFVLDIALNFNTGFVDRDKLVMQRIPSIKRYLAFWFWIDVLATIPFDLILGALLNAFDGDVLSVARLARLTKVTKMLKTLRFLKLLRMIRVVNSMGRSSQLLEMSLPLKYSINILQLFVVLGFMAHLHGCVWALLQPDMVHHDDIDLAFENYYLSVRWAYKAICVGEMGSSLLENPGLWTLEIFIAFERIFIALVVGSWGVVTALTIFQEDARLKLVKCAAVRVFRQHQVSIETQISVMYCLHETRAAQKMQRHFKVLMSEHLPEELRRTVSEELWTSHLSTLDLIWHIRWWHEDFASELSLLVREEVVASKTILCKAGHASIAAYYILKGRLEVLASSTHAALPAFTDGMWVEETALVSPIRRRTNTIITPILTRLMTVPTQAFHNLIATLGLETRFQAFREGRLAHGLCGRCGNVGDHFTHACPRSANPTFARLTSRRWSINGKRPRKTACQEASEDGFSILNFLHAHRLTSLAPLLQEQQVQSRAELDELDFDALDAKLVGNEEMRKELSVLNQLVRELQEQAQFQVSEKLASAQHLVFLSHYKMESGTEAALMRQELERVLLEDNEPLARSMHVPIFLDSEDLSDLKELREHVRRSHNLVLLLTKDVLLRPWVLVEIVTAIEAGVRLVPVTVTKTGAGFVFPDDAYYARLVAGQVLDSDGQTLLRELGIELEDIERALRTVFQKIAVPYSPHRSENIRMAEIKVIYKQLRSCAPRDSWVPNQELQHSEELHIPI